MPGVAVAGVSGSFTSSPRSIAPLDFSSTERLAADAERSGVTGAPSLTRVAHGRFSTRLGRARTCGAALRGWAGSASTTFGW
eukprot:14449702-Alexandrium_andersonii.AAC.1